MVSYFTTDIGYFCVLIFISRRAKGPGLEILKCPPPPSHLVFAQLENALLYFLETLQACAPCHGGVLYSF